MAVSHRYFDWPKAFGKIIAGTWFGVQSGGKVIDGADQMEEAQLFHLWNRAQEDGQELLLISDAERWDIALPTLDRALGPPSIWKLARPGDAMIVDLIESQAAQRRLALGEGALTYLLPRATRSFAAIERLVDMIDRLSLERKAPATLSIWRDALEAVQGAAQPKLL